MLGRLQLPQRKGLTRQIKVKQHPLLGWQAWSHTACAGYCPSTAVTLQLRSFESGLRHAAGQCPLCCACLARPLSVQCGASVCSPSCPAPSSRRDSPVPSQVQFLTHELPLAVACVPSHPPPARDPAVLCGAATGTKLTRTPLMMPSTSSVTPGTRSAPTFLTL